MDEEGPRAAAGEPQAADGPGAPPPAGRPVAGPVALPPEYRPRDGRRAWVVAGAVAVLAIVLYVFTRGGGGGPGSAPTPRWGALTLSRVALAEARAAGDAHPRTGVWVFATHAQALAALTGSPGHSAVADYVVVLTGRFQLSPTGALPGSQAQGTRLALVVRGFDGGVTDRLVTDRALRPALTGIGIVHSLRLHFW